MPRRTKIVATLGPASNSAETVLSLVKAGVDVFRVNLSHGSLDELAVVAERIRDAANSCDRVVAVLADLPGPKVRCGDFGDEGVHLATGTQVSIVPGEGSSDTNRITVDYPSLLDDLARGDTVIIGDGVITLTVTDADREVVRADVMTGGQATGRPGFHIPSERVQLCTPTPHDIELLQGIQDRSLEVDYVAVSFVRTAKDIQAVRDVLGGRGPRIVAKIETVPAVDHLSEILDVADALMVARGDLGIEMPLEAVPLVQKAIIRQAVAAAVPVITATQMLESMINAPMPTRAEVSDVANAVFDGTDALMLSGETAIGHDPANVVRTMARIASRVESDADYFRSANLLWRPDDLASRPPKQVTEAAAHAAWSAAHDVHASAILCSTRHGRTAGVVARYRPAANLIGLSPDDGTLRRLALVWGVTPRAVHPSTSTDEMVARALEAAQRAGDVHSGDTVVVLAGSPDSPSGATDVLRLVDVD
jgi:pyruvate kinase